MTKNHTICDLCSRDVTGATTLQLIAPAAYHQHLDVCTDCLALPIWDVAEKVRCYQVEQEKAMSACQVADPCAPSYASSAPPMPMPVPLPVLAGRLRP